VALVVQENYNIVYSISKSNNGLDRNIYVDYDLYNNDGAESAIFRLQPSLLDYRYTKDKNQKMSYYRRGLSANKLSLYNYCIDDKLSDKTIDCIEDCYYCMSDSLDYFIMFNSYWCMSDLKNSGKEGMFSNVSKFLRGRS
jgi:hypothetical protein